MHCILKWTLLVVGISLPDIEDLGLVQYFMMETQDFLVFVIRHLVGWSHFDEKNDGKR